MNVPLCCFCHKPTLSWPESMGWRLNARNLSDVKDEHAGIGFMKHRRTRARICSLCIMDLIAGSVKTGFMNVQSIIDENAVVLPKPAIERRPIPMKVRIRVLRKYGFKCAQCPSEDDLHIDHINPVSRGGKDDEDNLQVLCRTCNLRKGDKV